MAYRNGYADDREMDRDDRISDVVNKPIHNIEHLATFTVTKETGIIYPADGMRRLLQLEKTNGIWSQKMQLCLDGTLVLIMDYETGGVMERFPANSIQEPTAFMSQDPMELYNNILVFIVTNLNQSHPPEMHIFQCLSISAQDLVEDLMQLRVGKALTRSRKSSIPPPSHKPLQNVINPARDITRDYHGSDSELTANNDDSSSTTSEKYERDVTILNHCFDDIEKFIARLQYISAARRELDRRRKTRKSKKRDMGDGMLTMRTKPPPEKEFVDIFQKFKLSFNLLAKLKAHIHDPNAPELVHFLFTPLALIVEASNDTYFDQHIPHNVISPLLTREAINLLEHCVTSKETELWHSLGSAWLIPRDQYKGHVSSYHPVFMDGWSPEYPVLDEPESEGKFHGHEGQYNTDYNDYPSSPQEFYERGHPEKELTQNIIESTRSEISIDSIERSGGDDRSFGRNQEAFLEDLQNRGANIVQVTYPRTANNDKELTVVRGEYLEILDDSRKWWKARNSRGHIAHVPHTIVTPYSFKNYSRRAESPLERPEPNIPDHSGQMKTNTDWIRNERIENCVVDSSVPPPPPPPPLKIPPPPPEPTRSEKDATPPIKRTTSRQSIISAHSTITQEELTSVLTLVRERGKQRVLDIKQTPDTYINQNSSPSEVQEWLKKKGFSDTIRTRFKNIGGYEILGMQKKDLELIGGRYEGKRLNSQINIQKSYSGYQTVRTTELNNKLARRRQKIDSTASGDSDVFQD